MAAVVTNTGCASVRGDGRRMAGWLRVVFRVRVSEKANEWESVCRRRRAVEQSIDEQRDECVRVGL
jgi:hypothetical protein